MVENKGKSLPKIAVELDIHVATAFYWRHKINNALRSVGHATLCSIVESEETYVLESEKGKKGGIAHRKPRKRGGKAKKRGISDEQVSIVAALDRNGAIFSQIAGQHVNRYHGELKYWLRRFDGVATRYLDNYNTILLAACQKPSFTRVNSF